jgi:predicted CXXCH cytochrome family protein
VERWDLSPGYTGKQQIELAKPIEEPCLYCHASGAQPIAKTQNGYLDPPFLEGGVGCERCHGSGEKHIKTHRDIVNPAKLEPGRRDSVCQQCHLTGVARVPRPGHSVGTFRPGDLLSDHVTVFVRASAGGKAAATDHSEQLAASKCKLASGDKLWCGTCHNPHAAPATSARVAYYRQSCLQCHAQQGCALGAEARAAAKDDCASCHMPKSRSREGEHVVYTDHRIVRRTIARSANTPDSRLRSFWGRPAEERDLAIAYASLGGAALPLLEKLRSSDDTPALVQLGQLYDAAGKEDSAEKIYERVLRLDPSNASAEANLAIYRARRGRVTEAMTLWQDVFARNPALAGAGINLAVAQSGAGDRVAAEETVRRLLRFHPDLEAVRQLAAKLR